MLICSVQQMSLFLIIFYNVKVWFPPPLNISVEEQTSYQIPKKLKITRGFMRREYCDLGTAKKKGSEQYLLF